MRRYWVSLCVIGALSGCVEGSSEPSSSAAAPDPEAEAEAEAGEGATTTRGRAAEGPAPGAESPAPASGPASRPGDFGEGAVPTHGRAASRHQVAYGEPSCEGAAPCTCRGTLHYGKNALAQIGITPEILAAGTPCLIADFDANGVDDLAFVDGNFGHEKLAARVTVLMFDEVGLMATAALPKRVRSLGLAPAEDGSIALIEPGYSGQRFRFVYRDGRFLFEERPPNP